MGYKILGYLVWKGAKAHVKLRLRGARRTVAISAVVALVLAGALGAASRQRAAQDS
jgi:hypothetical protein